MGNAKIKLTIYIVLVCILLITTSLGIVLAVKHSNESGNIDFSGEEVDMIVSAKISGMKNAPQLPDIIINKDTDKNQSWSDLVLEFDDKNSQIEIVITINNCSDKELLQIIFENKTTTENITIEENCFFNQMSSKLHPIEKTMVVNTKESISYKLNFKIKDLSKSVKDKLLLSFVCANVL